MKKKIIVYLIVIIVICAPAILFINFLFDDNGEKEWLYAVKDTKVVNEDGRIKFRFSDDGQYANTYDIYTGNIITQMKFFRTENKNTALYYGKEIEFYKFEKKDGVLYNYSPFGAIESKYFTDEIYEIGKLVRLNE